MAQEISIFHLSTGNLYLRDITFVIDVSVSTIETIKLVFKLVFLKQFISCYGRFWNRRKRYVCEKGNIEGRERGCRQSLYWGTKTFHNAGGKPTRGFSLTIQHKTFSALNCTQDCGNRVKKESLKRNTNSNSRKVESSHVKYFHAFVSTLHMSLPSVQTKTKEDEVGMGVN